MTQDRGRPHPSPGLLVSLTRHGRTYDLGQGEAWLLPANTPVERRCEETCEVVFFKFFCECLPGVDPLIDWKNREPRRMRNVDIAEWRTWLESDRTLGISSILGLRGRLLWWMVQTIPELDEVIALHLASHSRFSDVFQYAEDRLRSGEGSGRRTSGG